MSTRNINFKNKTGGSSHNSLDSSIHNSPNEFRERSRNRIPFGAVISTRARRDTNSYSRIAGWSFAILTIFGLFSYLTFIPRQAFAAYDWETRKLSNITTMQQINAKICENTTEIGTQYQLEDTRDGKKYYVAKLQDGNCWMTQNLAYGTASTTSIGTPCTLSGTSCSGWINSTTDKYFAIGSHTEDNEAAAHASQGNFYNWPAAVAGDTSTTEPKQGICPNNWQLPTSNNTNSKSFGGLANAYSAENNEAGSTIFRGEPLYFQYSGIVNSGTLYNAGSVGYYWSSTPDTSDANNAYYLGLGSSNAGPSNSDGRNYGFSVRCVAANVYPDEPILDDNQANVAITVSPVISIDVTKHANDMTVDFTKVATSTIIARVGSNQPYQVLLSTDKSDLTNPSTDKTIPMIPSDQTVVKGTNSWGIKKLSSPTDTIVNDSTIYSPVGINGNKALFYESTSAASEDLTFPVAIAVDSSLPSGQYSTQVTLTAVAM